MTKDHATPLKRMDERNPSAIVFAFAPDGERHMLRPVEEKAGKAIVIVDDESSFTEMLSSLLGEHFRCAILTFSNPNTALEALPNMEVGLLVTDYYMPRRNGIDLIRTVGQIMPAPPPCLLITAHTFEDDEEAELMPHFKAKLAKPFRWQQLAALIEKFWPVDAPCPLRDGATSLNR